MEHETELNSAAISALQEKLVEKDSEIRKLKAASKRLEVSLSSVKEKLMLKPMTDEVVEAAGEIPNGCVTLEQACDVFSGIKSKMLIPVWGWDSKHPMVPEKNPDYIFREEILMRALYALTTNQRMYLQGHTGSGKTTLLEQIAAHLNYPFIRINFDSEITRMDLIGRDTLVVKDGVTLSNFVDGLLPQMMKQPCIGCFDEIDFCRPDVAYVMQSALENNSLRITEDGGREVKPHPMFRMFATGNTVGQGDEHGMYQGARPQSMAFLDRFTVWAKVEYLSEKERFNFIAKAAPELDESVVTTINKYSTEHLEGFKDGKVMQPLSPRGMAAIATSTEYLLSVGKADVNKALRQSLYMTVLDRASSSDLGTLKEIIDRVTR